MDCNQLADEIIRGRRLTGKDDLSGFITADLDELRTGADRIREHFIGDKVDLCTIISGRSGKCSENCKFCARFSIVNSGKSPLPRDFDRIVSIFRKMHETLEIELCCSLGFMTAEQFGRLHEAGVVNVHCNLETSRRYFPSICTTHTYEDKIENIRRAQQEGMFVCSGGIIGMGESWEDRIDLALELAGLGILSIPINSLMPIPGTPLENLPRLSEEEILRTIAIFRYINPEAHIRLAGGRALMRDNGRETFRSGASASITGNMLTTSGSTIASDRAMLEELGRDTTPCWMKQGGRAG